MPEALPGDPFEGATTPWQGEMVYRAGKPEPIRVDVLENFGPRSGEWRRIHPPISRNLEDLPDVRIVDGWPKPGAEGR